MLRRRLTTALPQHSSADTTTTSAAAAATSSSSSSSSNDVSPSILITVLILAIAVILFASLYLLLRFLRRSRHRESSSSSAAVVPSSLSSPSVRRVSPEIDSLPLFTYDRLTAKSGGDCAVCLSKFEHNDVLRLLPICCHVFHATCIDTWLSNNLTCPLCRSPIFLSSGEILGKISDEHSGSFRVEIGNVSNRQNSGEIRRSYSLGGDFDYVIAADEITVSDVTPRSIPRTTSNKVTDTAAEQQGALAAEVGTRGGGGWWLKDYLSSSSSTRTSSFRSSGRFFAGSSRRSTVESTAGNRENELVGEFDSASRLGDEIGELFRWLSGV